MQPRNATMQKLERHTPKASASKLELYDILNIFSVAARSRLLGCLDARVAVFVPCGYNSLVVLDAIMLDKVPVSLAYGACALLSSESFGNNSEDTTRMTIY